MSERVDLDPALDSRLIPSDILNEICQHALDVAPEECCGLVLGTAEMPARRVVRITNVMTKMHVADPNSFPKDARHAYYMSEVEYLRATSEAEAADQSVFAIYHSHFGQGCYLSRDDLAFAEHPLFPFPEANQIVVSVLGDAIREVGCFEPQRLSGGRTFVGRRLEAAPSTDGTGPGGRLMGRGMPSLRSGAGRFLLWAGLMVGALAAGCLTARMSPEDLPEQPIAFLHWADKASSKRADIFEKAAEVPGIPPDKEDPERLEELRVRSYLRGDQPLALKAQFDKAPGRLMLIWPRTGRLERVAAAPPGSLPLAWSPDRSRLLFTAAHRGGREQLYEYHLGREDLRPVTMGPLEHARGDYDRSGQILAHQIERVRAVGPSKNSVHRVGVGGELGPVLADEVPPGTVHASPTGDALVFEHVRQRPRRDGPTLLESLIAIVDPGNGAAAQILLKGREPVFTPDGAWVVFASPSSAGYRLRRMRLDGSSRVPIGRGGPVGEDERMPAVSPDGEFVAFVRSSNGRRRLAVRRFDGKDERVLLASGWSEFPVW